MCSSSGSCRFRRFLSELQAADLRRDKTPRRGLSHYLVHFLVSECLRPAASRSVTCGDAIGSWQPGPLATLK